MIDSYEDVEVVTRPSVLTCDVCGKRMTKADDWIEFQEAYVISFTGGYGSVFGDGTHIGCVICQHCLLKMIGDHCFYETDDGFAKFKA